MVWFTHTHTHIYLYANLGCCRGLLLLVRIAKTRTEIVLVNNWIFQVSNVYILVYLKLHTSQRCFSPQTVWKYWTDFRAVWLPFIGFVFPTAITCVVCMCWFISDKLILNLLTGRVVICHLCILAVLNDIYIYILICFTFTSSLDYLCTMYFFLWTYC